MKTRRCAVCGTVRPVVDFGDGVTCPKTTCLNCKKRKLTEPKVLMSVKRIIKGEEW